MIIYDCSNSTEYTNRPPKDNEIVRYLKENAAQYGHSFTDDPHAGEVYFTNDIFPSTLENDKIKAKRMDGVFNRHDNKHRNEPLNKAAAEADLVIFISEYARTKASTGAKNEKTIYRRISKNVSGRQWV